MSKFEFTEKQVQEVSEFLQSYMRKNNFNHLTANECAELLAKENILTNQLGPKPGFNFRQMLRDGRDGKISLVKGATQERPGTRWSIYKMA